MKNEEKQTPLYSTGTGALSPSPVVLASLFFFKVTAEGITVKRKLRRFLRLKIQIISSYVHNFAFECIIL